MFDIGRERSQVIASEREEEQLDVSFEKQKDDNAPKSELSEEYGYPVVGEQSECHAIAEQSEQNERNVEQEVLDVRLKESLSCLLNAGEG